MRNSYECQGQNFVTSGKPFFETVNDEIKNIAQNRAHVTLMFLLAHLRFCKRSLSI